jgi:hypothetical protein
MTPFEQQTLNTSIWRTLNIYLSNAMSLHLLWPSLQNHSWPIYKITRILVLESHDALSTTQIAMCLKFSTINKTHRMYRLQITSLEPQQLEQTLIVMTLKMLQLVSIHSQLTSFKPQLKQTINLTHATTIFLST